MTQAQPLDPRTQQLTRGDKAVDAFRVAGLVTELALKASLRLDVGMTGLQMSHLPHTVLMTLDGYRGEKHVLVRESDKTLAVQVAKKVRVALHRLGIEIKDCVVRAESGAQGADHDMVLEVVDCPDESLAVKKLSGELKLRRLRSSNGRDAAREAFGKECVSENAWWAREAQTGRWGGRIVVMANFAQGCDGECDLYADFYPVAGVRQSLLGWPGARRTFRARAAPAAAAPAVGAVGRVAPVVAPLRAAPVATSKPPWAEVYAKLKPNFAMRRGSLMASVPLMLTIMKVSKSKRQNLHRDLQKWKTLHNWNQSQLDACKRKGPDRVPGGRSESVATKETLQVIYGKY